MNIYQSKNLAVITISRFTIEGIQPATAINATESDFRSSKMVAGSHFVKKKVAY